MRPKAGIQLSSAIEGLRRCATDAENVASSGLDPIRLRDDYLRWSDDAERVLRGLFSDFEISDLQTDRFWQIRGITEETTQPFPLIYREVEAQASRLRVIADRLETRASHLAAPAGQITVPDTNVFLHFQLFDTIDWAEVVGIDQVRIVVPLRVIEELDLKKASRRSDLAGRASKVLARLESLLGPTPREPARLSDSATIEVLLDHNIDPTHQSRDSSADSEILAACEFLALVTDQRVYLVTGDVSMRLRATAKHQKAIPMPDSFRVKRDQDASG